MKIAVAGRNADPIFKKLHETVLSTFCPHALVVPLERGRRPPLARDSAFDFLCLERQIKSLALPP